jgi:hypothetical protein
LVDDDAALLAAFLDQADRFGGDRPAAVARRPGGDAGLFEDQRVEADDATVVGQRLDEDDGQVSGLAAGDVGLPGRVAAEDRKAGIRAACSASKAGRCASPTSGLQPKFWVPGSAPSSAA